MLLKNNVKYMKRALKATESHQVSCLLNDTKARRAWNDIQVLARKAPSTIWPHQEKYSLKIDGNISAFEDSHKLKQLSSLKNHST